MTIVYHPQNKSGARYSIVYESGRQLTGVSLGVVSSELRKNGCSVREIESRVSDAKLAAMAAA